MKRRKLFQAMLAAVMLVCILSGCGSQSDVDGDDTGTSKTGQASAETKDTAAASENAADMDDTEDTNAATEAANSSDSEITFESLEVVNNDACTITVTGIDPDNWLGYALDVTLENKSDDVTYMYSVAYASINGVDCDPYFAAEVAPGKKSNESVSFTTSTLDEQGIGDYTDICICFRVYDSDDWTADDIAYTEVHVYPYGEENATVFEREAQEEDIVLVENDDVKITVIGYSEDSLFSEYEVLLYLENKTGNSVMFSIDDASVNGYMEDPYWAYEVTAETCAFSSVGWYWSYLEEDGITEIEEIEFTITAYDSDTYVDTYCEETVTLNP